MGDRMMRNYFVLRDGVVENVVVWDGVSDWTPRSGTELVIADTFASIGWIRQEDGSFAPPAPEIIEGTSEVVPE